MTVLSAAAAKLQSDNNINTDLKIAREAFEVAIMTAASLGQTHTSFEKKYFQLNLIMSEITAAGYDVTDEGSTWLVDWG